jgi:hypothetical protein
MEAAAGAVEGGAWSPDEVAFADLPARFGYRLSNADAAPPPPQLP